MVEEANQAVSSIRLQATTPQIDPNLVQLIDTPSVVLAASSLGYLSREADIALWYPETDVGPALSLPAFSDSLRFKQEGDVVILGDILQLSSNSFFGCNFLPVDDPIANNVHAAVGGGWLSRLFIIVDTLWIEGENNLYLKGGSADQPRSMGPRVVIAARMIRCESVALLTVRSDASNTSDNRVDGGTVLVYADAVTRSGEITPLDHLNSVVKNESPGRNGGNDGKLVVKQLRDSYDDNLVPRVVWNLWKDGFWRHVRNECLSAVQQQNRWGLIAALRRYRQTASPPALQEFQNAFSKLVLSFEAIAQSYVLGLFHRREEVVAPSGLTRSVDLLVEGAGLRNFVVPTEALIRAYRAAERDKVGFLTSDPNADEVTLRFDTEMTVPDWLEVALRKKLVGSNEELAGVFSNWKVTPTPDALPGGVKRVRVDVLDNTWRWEVTVGGDGAAVAVAQLAAPAGLPFSFGWKFAGDEAVEGRAFTVRPSLARRRGTRVVRQGASVANVGTRPVLVEYVRVGADGFHVLSPPLALEAGETKPLPLPAGASPEQASVPDAAVVHEASADLTAAGDFMVADTGSVFEAFTVESLIPARLEDRRQSVRYLEVRVEQLLGADEPFAVTEGGEHRLSPESLPGSVKSFRFMRPRAAARRYRVSGRIEYLGGGNQPLATRVVDTAGVDIDTSWLPPSD